jgi:hypothetical protein
MVRFAVGGDTPDSRFAERGDYVWYLGGVHLSGRGPAKLGAVAAPSGTQVLKFSGNWLGKGDFTVTPETTVIQGHANCVRTGGVVDPTLANQAVATFVPTPQTGKAAARLTFWCYPRDVAFLPVLIYDADNDCVARILDERQLKVGQWNQVIIEFTGRPKLGSGDGKMDAVTVVYFAPDPGYDPRHKYLTEKREYVWYVDDVEFSGEGPVPLDAGGKQ